MIKMKRVRILDPNRDFLTCDTQVPVDRYWKTGSETLSGLLWEKLTDILVEGVFADEFQKKVAVAAGEFLE